MPVVQAVKDKVAFRLFFHQKSKLQLLEFRCDFRTIIDYRYRFSKIWQQLRNLRQKNRLESFAKLFRKLVVQKLKKQWKFGRPMAILSDFWTTIFRNNFQTLTSQFFDADFESIVRFSKIDTDNQKSIVSISAKSVLSIIDQSYVILSWSYRRVVGNQKSFLMSHISTF